jgi:hypothetical protein
MGISTTPADWLMGLKSSLGGLRFACAIELHEIIFEFWNGKFSGAASFMGIEDAAMVFFAPEGPARPPHKVSKKGACGARG